MRSDLRVLLMIGVGGAIGSAARFGVGNFIQSRTGGGFPAGTMAINISGSLLLGFLLRFSLDTAYVSPEMRLLLTTGICGGFTTFSTFGYESVQLLERGEYGRATTYVIGSVVLSLIATAIGIALARWLIATGRFHTTPS